MEGIASAAAVRFAESSWFDAQSSRADEPQARLMRSAATAVANCVADLAGTRHLRALKILVVAGSGNNAGDALFAAADLIASWHDPVEVSVWPALGQTHATGLAAATGAGAVVIDAEQALNTTPGQDVIVDGFAGIGGRSGLPAPVAAIAGAAEMHRIPVVAVDIPSGLAADRPGASASFHATETVTFFARKLAHVARPAADRCGHVTCVDLGIPMPTASVFLIEPQDMIDWFPWPGPTSDKYSRGVVGFDTGSKAYPGAAVLGVSGALHCGAGMVRYAGPVRAAVLAAHPSVVAPLDSQRPGRVQAWVCGSGWPRLDESRRARRVADDVPLVLDASALLDPPDSLDAGSILTPHAGELAALLGVDRSAVTDDPVGHARRAAHETGACVLLKGATQYSAHPDGRLLIAESGPSWTAVAGSGDTLAGILGALMAGGVDAWRAGALAASLQARAAAFCPGPHTPAELATDGLPRAVAALEAERILGQ